MSDTPEMRSLETIALETTNLTESGRSSPALKRGMNGPCA